MTETMVNGESLRQLKLGIADIIIEARTVDRGIGLRASPTSQPFIVEEGKPDCVVDVHYGSLPDLVLEQQLFDSGNGAWVLYSSGEKLVFKLLRGHGQPEPHRLAVFQPNFNRGELFVCSDSGSSIESCQRPLEKVSLDPFLYPLDELLIINLLAQKRGLHIHALGVVYEGQGLIFCGVSGAGKSTLAELWKERPVKILSDDRLALRQLEGRLWVYGTPWHGDAHVSLPEKVPLQALYFIEHGQENRIVPLSATEVATQLLIRCFPTFYLRQGMEYSLSFITELAREIPCYELQFTPDQRAIDEVLNHVKGGML